MDTSPRFASAVAEAADAWLRDPRDVTVYRMLVEAVERWREYARPQLPGDAEPLELDITGDGLSDTVLMPGTLADGIRDLRGHLKPPAEADTGPSVPSSPSQQQSWSA